MSNLFIACAVMLTCFAGCKKDDPVTQAQSRDYYPVSVGIELLYQYTQSEYPAGGLSAEMWNGTQLWKLTDSSSDADKYYYHFRNIRHFVLTEEQYYPTKSTWGEVRNQLGKINHLNPKQIEVYNGNMHSIWIYGFYIPPEKNAKSFVFFHNKKGERLTIRF